MAGGWAQDNVSLGDTVVTAGVVSNSPITKEFRITPGGAVAGFVIKCKVTAINQVGTITLKLQSAIGADWVDAKSATLTATGDVYIRLMPTVAGDAAVMPLLNKGRLVLTMTNASDSVTVSTIDVLQEQ